MEAGLTPESASGMDTRGFTLARERLSDTKNEIESGLTLEGPGSEVDGAGTDPSLAWTLGMVPDVEGDDGISSPFEGVNLVDGGRELVGNLVSLLRLDLPLFLRAELTDDDIVGNSIHSLGPEEVGEGGGVPKLESSSDKMDDREGECSLL